MGKTTLDLAGTAAAFHNTQRGERLTHNRGGSFW
jgi:hypothetical protein